MNSLGTPLLQHHRLATPTALLRRIVKGVIALLYWYRQYLYVAFDQKGRFHYMYILPEFSAALHTTRTPFRLSTCLPATRRCQIRLFDDDDTERGLFLSANGFLRPAVLFGQVSCGRSEINPSWCWHLPLCHMQLLSLHHLLTVYNDSYIFSVSLGTKLYME